MLETQQPLGTSASYRLRVSLAGTRLAASSYLSSEERQALEEAAWVSRSIRASVDLVREGEHTDQFHILIDGWACRYKITRAGTRQIVAALLPGDAANLDSFLFDRLDYGVRALTPAKVLTISRDRLLALADKHVGIAKTLAWLGLVENAILSQWVLCLGRQSAQQRLAHLLCEISARLGVDEDAMESRFELPLTQEQIADALGLTAVHVNRTIQQLRAEGLIERSGRGVTIADMDALRRIGEFNPAYLHDGRDEATLRPVWSAVERQQMTPVSPMAA